MKKKTFLLVGSILMIVIGTLRGIGGISLYIKGSALATNQQIIATEIQTKLVAMGLMIVCILLILAASILLWKNSRRGWNLSLGALALFFIGGLINGFVLFGQPVDQGQLNNIIAVVVCSGLLLIGKRALSNSE